MLLKEYENTLYISSFHRFNIVLIIYLPITFKIQVDDWGLSLTP